MNRCLVFVLICLCSAAPAQQPGAVGDDDDAPAKPLAGKPTWPTVGGDLRRTATAAGPRIERFPAIRWALPLSPFRNTRCAPTAGYGRVFLPIGNNHSQANRLICVDAATGRQLWSQTSMGWLGTTCAGLGDRRVVFGGGDNMLRCHDARSGNLLWNLATGSHFFCYPLLADGVAYIACRDNVLYAMDVKTGKERWRYTGENHSKSSLALADGRLVLGERDKALICLAVKDGKKLWSFETDGWTDTPITLAGGLAFAGTREGTVYAVDLKDGKKRWSQKTEGAFRGPFALAGEILVAGNAAGQVVGFDLATGAVRWKVKANGAVSGGAVIVGEAAYVADAAGYLSARAWKDGTLRFSAKLGGSFLAPMACNREALFLVDAGEAEGAISGEYAMRKAARLLCVVDGWTDPAVLAAALGIKPQADHKERVAELIELLGDEEYRVREKADAELRQIGPAAIPQLTEAVAESGDYEIRERAAGILEHLGTATPIGSAEIVGQHQLGRDVEYLIHWLDAPAAATRAAVYRRLAAITEGTPPFDADASPERRAARRDALAKWWAARKAGLRWDEKAARYVPSNP